MKDDSKRNSPADKSEPKTLKQACDEAISKWIAKGSPMPSSSGGEAAPSIEQPKASQKSQPKYFYSPIGAEPRERIAYPHKSLTIDDLMDDESQRCVTYVEHRTGILSKDLISHWIKQMYDVEGCDASASYLRHEIARNEKKVA